MMRKPRSDDAIEAFENSAGYSLPELEKMDRATLTAMQKRLLREKRDLEEQQTSLRREKTKGAHGRAGSQRKLWGWNQTVAHNDHGRWVAVTLPALSRTKAKRALDQRKRDRGKPVTQAAVDISLTPSDKIKVIDRILLDLAQRIPNLPFPEPTKGRKPPSIEEFDDV